MSVRGWLALLLLGLAGCVVRAATYQAEVQRAQGLSQQLEQSEEGIRDREQRIRDLEKVRETLRLEHGSLSEERIILINQLEDLFDEPHLASSGFFRTEQHPTEGPLRVTRHPLDFTGIDEQTSRPAPRMGEHNRDILSEAGLSAVEIVELETAGVLGGTGE